MQRISINFQFLFAKFNFQRNANAQLVLSINVLEVVKGCEHIRVNAVDILH
jgi:hypothetical protein